MINTFYILSGAPGSGKSTILKQLKQRGYLCVDEPAREIIAEQKAINGDGLYNRDKKLFLELMISRSIYQYKQLVKTDKPVIFDRALPDLIAYAKLFEVDTASSINAAVLYKYNINVVFLPSWREIYTNDEDRTMSFTAAQEFGELIRQAYIDLNYNLITVPQVAINDRLNIIEKILTNY